MPYPVAACRGRNIGPTIPPFLATFTGTNGTTLNGLAPDSGPNALVIRSGVWTIQTNRASCGTQGIFTADIGRANYAYTGVVRAGGSGAGVALIVRYDPANGHFYMANAEIGAGKFRLYRYD